MNGSVLSVYDPQCGRSDEKNSAFYDQLNAIVRPKMEM